MINSCGDCTACRGEEEHNCRRSVLTYNGHDPYGTTATTYGGYSAELVVNSHFVLKVPDALDGPGAAPVLCAGITVYSPLRRFGAGPGTKVGVAGFGGLGMMATQMASAMGAEVTVLTRSHTKEAPARQAGASRVVVVTEQDRIASAARSLDLVLSTLPVDHNLNPYLSMLRRDGTYVLLGYFGELSIPLQAHFLTSSRISVTGSLIGGLRETQEALDFCAQHGIVPVTQTAKVSDADGIYDQLASGEPAHRFVLDLSTL